MLRVDRGDPQESSRDILRATGQFRRAVRGESLKMNDAYVF